MKFLFIHQNFPGQFKHLAPALAAAGHQVIAIGINKLPVEIPGVRYLLHKPKPARSALRGLDIVSVTEFHGKTLRGESTALCMQQLKDEGFTPDVVFAHPGWGEAYFVKDVFPDSKLLIYAEYYYQAEGGDAAFDPEFSHQSLAGLESLRLKNTHLLHAMNVADGGLSPTHFQRDRHPPWFRERISVIHEGIDTDHFRPDPKATVRLRSAGLTLHPSDEVVTFVARELEPYRGYHIFMRALPELLRQRPNARVVIVGGSDASYGARAPEGTSWKDIFLKEVVAQLDMSRVHFVGKVSHKVLTQLMQVSAVHAYLTYPFVLSWSMLEAMSIGCLIVASRTAPVEEVIVHGRNGLLVDFFDPAALAHAIADALERRVELQALRAAARQTVIERYDLRRQCLPALLRFAMS